MATREEISDELKISIRSFGCTWDLICETDTEDIAAEYARIILKCLHSQRVVIKVDRGGDNKYLFAEFYTSKMPVAVDSPDIKCCFYEPIVESLVE